MLLNEEKYNSFNLELNKKILKENCLPIQIVLDIDDVLATGFHSSNLQKLLEDHPYLKDFEDLNLLINAVFPHMIHPGAIELIQWIFQIPNVNVSFFSSGEETRNTAFVKELLTLALGDSFDKIKDNIGVFSRQHLVVSKEEETKNQFKLFKIYHGSMKKDLSKILNIDNLDNAILIDDDSSYIACGQERNVMVVPGADEYPFYEFYRDANEFPDCMEKNILSMNHIFYIAGMLSRIFNTKNNCLADNLFCLQYKSNADGTHEYDGSIHNELQFYLDGLSELQKVNPKLEFYGGELANEHFTKASFTNKF
ncbi:MAG: hypothetical protein H0W64_01315 [Gammaproteobacteria bacterium]|nr:hypothetical protein [Gammaproteobacteria bacterium]